MLRFDGKVAIVSGSGGGLGRAYALFFASRGAKVVINDLSKEAADRVVLEITSSNGIALANYNSIEDGDKIVAATLAEFGRIDIIINNAGILRDKSFIKMTDADWNLVHKGAYKLTHAAWPHMIAQGYGRIINTASAAGIYGNFGQSNYSSAKLALVWSTEGAKKNVLVNTIAPLAASKMTETIMPAEMLAKLNPEYIVPLVAILAHDTCPENGSLFEAGAGWFGKLRRQRSLGTVFKADATFTPATLAPSLVQINDFSKSSYPTTIMDTDWLALLSESTKRTSNPATPHQLRFEGKVAVVTGAGNGLGRAYALMFAKYGAMVVVNDLGGSTFGAGANASAADKVVAEIVASGGRAVADYNSVEQGEKIIETAIGAFGRIDILVNNAGILRDKSFVKMEDSDWDLVYNVHLHGSYKTAKAAWPHMLKQKYGRIINTSSAVGLYGNFGQANYSAAKAGLIALTNTLAIEGVKSNILVNTVAPNAGTRITATVLPAEMVEALKPEYVAPLVGFLCHESSGETGGVYEVGSGWVARVRWERSGGVGFRGESGLSPETVRARWSEICDFTNGKQHYPSTTQDSFSALQHNFENQANVSIPSVAAASKVDVAGARKAVFPTHSFTYTERDVIMYALGVGAKKTDLALVYESNPDFKPLPTFSIIPAFDCMSKATSFTEFLPEFNPMHLLHGEQYLKIYAPLPASGTLVSQGRIVDIVDKGKGCVVVTRVETKTAKGELMCVNEFSNFIRGVGGFGNVNAVEREPAAVAANVAPSRTPDKIVREQTNPDLAALYRLSGDFNPLHIDPAMSALGGFKVPILHGLCTMGMCVKVVGREYAEMGGVGSAKVRFVKHVFPGETVEVRMWKEDGKVAFEAWVVERDCCVISGAAVEFAKAKQDVKDEVKEAKEVKKESGGNPLNVDGFQASAVFLGIEAAMLSKPSATRTAEVSKTKSIFAFEITNASKLTSNWFVDLKSGEGAVSAGKPAKADMTVVVSDADFMGLASGKLNPQKAFMQGKIKVKGNVGLASKLESVLGGKNAKL